MASWLGIPTRGPPVAVLRGGGPRPAEWELRPRPCACGSSTAAAAKSLLVAGGGLNSRGLGVASRSKTGRGPQTGPIFPAGPAEGQAPERLDLDQDARRALDSVPGLIVTNWMGDGFEKGARLIRTGGRIAGPRAGSSAPPAVARRAPKRRSGPPWAVLNRDDRPPGYEGSMSLNPISELAFGRVGHAGQLSRSDHVRSGRRGGGSGRRARPRPGAAGPRNADEEITAVFTRLRGRICGCASELPDTRGRETGLAFLRLTAPAAGGYAKTPKIRDVPGMRRIPSGPA